MRQEVHLPLLAVFCTVLAACGGGRDSADASSSGADEKVLHVYNWADYIGESTIRDFEARTGIKVVYDVYDASEVLQTKLLTGQSGYDVVITSGAATGKLIAAGTLRKLDQAKLSNLGNLDPQLMQRIAIYEPDADGTRGSSRTTTRRANT